MNNIYEEAKLVFYDKNGKSYFPVKIAGNGGKFFDIKSKKGSNRKEDSIQLDDWVDIARAMLIDKVAARCKSNNTDQTNYLIFGAKLLERYELDNEIAKELGIPNEGGIADISVVIDRTSVELAMDAYDAFREGTTDGTIFESFGDPREYWVRSTRERPNRVYPTKPLVGYLQNKTRTELNGGWGQKGDAAAFLHNLGYIIVDEHDQPKEPPSQYTHLMTGADRIRFVALNYYIQPAKGQGAYDVSIAVDDIAKAVLLKNAFPSICQALGGKRFQRLANLPPPTSTQPNPSSTTVFTYRLKSHSEADVMKETTENQVSLAENLILYGPPGTGKTYQTAWEAIRLCLGDEVASELNGPEQRNVLMSKYRQLSKEGRIEFVTFHQSLSYEEFVEGLRPETESDETIDGANEPSAPSGFRLRVEDGIFKRIARRAEASRGQISSDSRLSLEGRNIYKMSLGAVANPDEAEIFDEAINESCIIFGFFPIDFSSDEFAKRSAIEDRVRQDQASEEFRIASKLAIHMTDIFRNQLKIGDVILVSKGNLLIRAIGIVEGEYEYHPRQGSNIYPHKRAMRWLWVDEAGVPASDLYNMAISQRTIYRLREKELNVAQVERYMNSQNSDDIALPEPHVLIIDEINRANISKVFGELITLLEPDKRIGMDNEIRLTLPYSKKSFGVPQNLHIIGTMNTADRSIALLDTALRRRFSFRELMPNPTVLPSSLDGINLQKLLSTINERIEFLFDREHQIGHAYFTDCRTRTDVENALRMKVIPLLTEYFYEDWSKVAAVLGDNQQGKSHFIKHEKMLLDIDLSQNDAADEKLRWTVKTNFDFSEFAS